MSSRPPTPGRPGQEPADTGRFAPLASARRLLLTTFNPDGVPVYTPVRAAVNGDRAYFRMPGASGASKRLRHTDWVQVAPGSVLGLCRYEPTVNAIARPLAGEQAGQAAQQLARKYPPWRGFLSSLACRLTGRQIRYYELRADEAAAEPAAPPTAAAQVVKLVPVRLAPAGDGRRGRAG